MNCVNVETAESATITIQIVDARGRKFQKDDSVHAWFIILQMH